MASFYYFQYFSGKLSSVMVLARNMNCEMVALGGCQVCTRLTGSLKGSCSTGQYLAGPMEKSVLRVSQLPLKVMLPASHSHVINYK